MTHTPAPWSFDHNWQGSILILGPSGRHIGTLEKHASGTPGSGIPVDTHGKEQTANARLIAAAPLMLMALERLTNCPDVNFDELEDETREALDEALAAIAEAKGESK